ncbi:hypothetical protein DRN69_08740 [Candidatus Pacearchaeota archaeon]|nr:MAG: hypothetical protein DRN69_08740 [Candidatus Pacearchaeota archaeon]
MKIFIANLPWKLSKNEYGVRAGSRWAHKRNKKRDLYYYPFPFFLAYATAVLEKEGYNVFLKDYLTLELTEEEFLNDLKEKKPDIFVAEVSTPSFKNDIAICKKIKEVINCKIILCGPHVTVFPKETLKEYKFIDYILIGEYEYTLKELIDKLINKKSIKNILGLGYRDRGKIIFNKRRPLIQNLDELPFPARHFLPMERYNDSFCRNYPCIQLISSRGCPYRCIFCLEPNVIYGNPGFRVRSAKNVVDEIAYVIEKYGAKEVYFDDASFTIGKQRVLEICKEIKCRHLKIKWSCMADAINPDEEMLREMSNAGCVAIKFGVESADEKILKNISKVTNLEKTKQVVKLCRKYGIKTHATYMFGLPGETKETIKKTINYALNLGTNSAQFSIAVPFPGTPFYNLAKKERWLTQENWEQFDGNRSYAINHPNLSKEELYAALIYAQNRFWKRLAFKPDEVFYFLKRTYNMEGFFKTLRISLEKIRWVLSKI